MHCALEVSIVLQDSCRVDMLVEDNQWTTWSTFWYRGWCCGWTYEWYVCWLAFKTPIIIYTKIRVRLLATMIDSNRSVKIPGFCMFTSLSSFGSNWWFSIDDRVRPQTAEEKELYKLLSDVTQKPASLLSSRWREPSMTIHNIAISGPKGKTSHVRCVAKA